MKNKFNSYLSILSLIMVISFIPMFMFIVDIDFNSLRTTVRSGPIYDNEEDDKIHFIAAGGDAILIESNGKFGLIDSSNPKVSDATSFENNKCCIVHNSAHNVDSVKAYLTKVLNGKKLSFVIGTHSHSDHIGGMSELCEFLDSQTHYYYRPYIGVQNPTEATWFNDKYSELAYNTMVSASGVNYMHDVTDNNIGFSMGDFNISLINTETDLGTLEYGDNANSIGTLIQKGHERVFLAADIEFKDELKLFKQIGHVNILKAGHHGTETSSFYPFMSTLRPEIIIVTNSIANLNNVDHFQKVNKFMSEKYHTVTYAYNDNLFNMNAYSENITDKAIVVNIKSNSFNVNSTEDCVFSKTSDYSSWLTKGWKYTRGRWYYLGNDYMPLSGWQKINYQGKDRWFFFDNNNYFMYLGWQKLDWNGKNNWYYFSEVTDENVTKGEMLLGWQRLIYNNQLDWYYFNNSGAMVTGWQKLDWNGISSWYYFAKSGAMATGWRYLDWNGKYNYYYFDTTPGVRGAMYTGTHEIDGVTYEFDKSGACTNCNNLFDSNSIADNTVEKKIVSNSLDFTMPEDATETKQDVYNSNSTYVPELDKPVELANNLDNSNKKLSSKNKMFSTTYTNKNNAYNYDSKHTKLFIIIGSFISLAVIVALVIFITIEVKKKKN